MAGFGSVPAELRERDQWVCWRFEDRGGKKTKVPVNPNTSANASSTDPGTWGTFEAAVARAEAYRMEGVGFVFSADDPFCGVDLDGVLDRKIGEVEEWAMGIVEELDSYTEVSPSGTGLHVFVEGEVPKSGPKTLPDGRTVEVYDRGRFFTVTGRRLEGTSADVEERQAALDELLPLEDANERAKTVPEKLTEGSREPVLYSLAGSMFRRGLTAEEVMPTLLAVNEQRCEPPHGEEYVREIAEKIFERGYEPGGLTAGVTGADSTDGADGARGETPHAAGPLPPAVPFPVDALPDIPRRLVEEGAASTGTTPDMFAALVLSALGGAVGTSRMLVLKRNWKEYPAIWTCVVSSSGDKKTPAFRIAMAPAYAEQGRLVKQWREGMERHKREIAEWSERRTQAKKDKTEFGEPKPEEPELSHVFVQDVTVEELGVILSKTPRGVSALWDELSGFFAGMDQYKSGGKGNERTKYLSMWNGAPPLKVDRRGEGFVWAERPLVSVTGTIQPSVLPALSRRHAGVVGGDDGMAHRFLFSYPEPPVILSDLTDYDVSPLTDTYYGFLYESLRSLGPDEEGNPVEVRFTEEGEAAFRQHNEGFRRRMYLPGVTEAYKSAVAKLASSQLARVTLLLCLVRSAVGDGGEEVTDEDVQRAAKIIDYFVAHARRVHAVLFPETREQRLLRVLAGLVSERGTEDTPGSGVRRLKMSAEDFRLALTKGGDHNAPAANELTKVLRALAEKEPRLEVKKGYLGKGRALDVVLLPPGVPGGPVGSVGTVGGRNAPGEPVTLLNEKGAKLVLFVLRRHGPLFPREIAELTGKTHGAVKKIVSELRTAGKIKDTGETDDHGSRRVALVSRNPEYTAGEANPSYPTALQGRTTEHVPEDPVRGTGEEPAGHHKDQRLPANPGGAALRSRPTLVAPEDVPALLERIAATRVVALDLETTGLDPRRDEVRLLSLAIEHGAWVLDLSSTDVTPVLEALKGKTFVIHNAAFDLGFLRERGYEYEGEVIDTMLLSQLLYAGIKVPPLKQGRTSHALGDVCLRELGVVLDKEHQTADWAAEVTPEMAEYATRDAEVLVPLHRRLMKKIEEAGLSRTLEIEQSVQHGILWMARSGLPFDEARWLELAEDASREAARLNTRLQEMAPPHPEGKEWNWNSHQQVKQALSMLGLPVEDTRDETLARLEHPFARSLREYRKQSGIATRHGEKWLRDKDGTKRVIDGRVYPAWRQIGAATGRMACADPNLQAIPHGSGHHSCVRASEGRVLVKADYSQIELRLAAKMWDEPVMLGTFRDGGDVHTTTARSITGKEKVTKEERKLAKAVNFGLIFGQGAKGLRQYARNNYGVDMSLEEAVAYRRRFFETYKGIARWHASDDALLRRKRFETRTLTGRRRLDVRSYTEHLNAPVQGTAADGMKMALALLWERRNECPGAAPILAVHDEIVVECDADKAQEAKEWLVRVMKDGMDAVVNTEEPYVPIEVEASVSKTWGD